MYMVLKKELNTYRRHMLLYLAAAGLMLYTGVRFGGALFSQEIVEIRTVFSEIANVLVLFIPLLTMDSFAAEKYLGSDRILFSSAIRLQSVVFSKFLAAFLIFAAFSAATLLFPMIGMLLTGMYWKEILLLYLGVLLMGAVVCAMGVFISSMSSHGFRALLVTVAVLFAWWMLEALLPHMTHLLIRHVIRIISVFSRFHEFQYGLLSYSAILYLITCTLLFQVGTVQVLQIWRQKRV